MNDCANLDPKGVYGLAIVEVQEETLVNNIAINDPAIKASVGFKFEIYPIVDPVLRKVRKSHSLTLTKRDKKIIVC